jgi:WD40 repeat protein
MRYGLIVISIAAMLVGFPASAEEKSLSGYAPIFTPPQELAVLDGNNMAQLERVGTLGRGNTTGIQAYSHDKRWLALDSSAGIWIYDANDWAQLPRLIEYTANRIDFLHFSPDDTVLVSVCDGMALCAWQVETGQFLGQFSASTGRNDPYGWTSVLTNESFTKIAMWQSPINQLFRVLFEINAQDGNFSTKELALVSTNSQTAQTFYPKQFMHDAKRLFVVYPDAISRTKFSGGFYDLASGQPLATPLDELLKDPPFFNAAFTSDNQYLVIERDKSIVIVDVAQAAIKHEIAYPEDQHDYNRPIFRLSPDSQFIAILTHAYAHESDVLARIEVWNLTTGIRQSEVAFRKMPQFEYWWYLRDYQFSEDSKGLITKTSGSLPIGNLGEQALVEWDVITGEPRLPLSLPQTPPNSLTYQFAALTQARQHRDNSVSLNCLDWDGQSPILVDNPTCTTYDNEGSPVYAADDSGRWFVNQYRYGGDLLVWDLDAGKMIRYIHHTPVLKSLQFRPGSTQFMTATDAIRLWEGTTGEFLHVFGAVRGSYLQATFNHAGNYLAGAQQIRPTRQHHTDCTINRLVIWNTSEYQITYQLESYGAPIQFLEDDTILIAQNVQGERVSEQPCVYTGRLQLLDALTGEVEREFRMDEPRYFTSVTLSGDGSLLAGGTSDGWLYVWDFALGELLYQQQVETTPLTGLFFSVDGRMLLTGTSSPQYCSGSECASGIIKIWGVPMH